MPTMAGMKAVCPTTSILPSISRPIRRSSRTSAAPAEPQPWRPELTEQPTAVLDPHMISRAIRRLLLDNVLTDFLALIFGAPPRLIESRAGLRDVVPPDRDVAWHACSLPLQLV